MKINNPTSNYADMSKFHFDANVLLFRFAHVKTLGCKFMHKTFSKQ